MHRRHASAATSHMHWCATASKKWPPSACHWAPKFQASSRPALASFSKSSSKLFGGIMSFADQAGQDEGRYFGTSYTGQYRGEDGGDVAHEAVLRLAQTGSPEVDVKAMSARRVAAVLVLLHLSSDGTLAVLLTQRSKHLKSHPGDTALPGGRVEPSDQTVISTALREANEEIGLPLDDQSHYAYLATLEPFVSRNLLIVYPVVYAYTQPIEVLMAKLVPSQDEVAQIFCLPLKSVLDASNQAQPGKLTHSSKDFRWIEGNVYRWHSFENNDIPSPLAGLTADIILAVAGIAYKVQEPLFGPINAPGQANLRDFVQWVLAGKGGEQNDEFSLIRSK
ncbi:hypothetical protein O181_031396 [Austropuccinia psidii MF-1]|uniref:Nudix hydrolase domain-containing protein n=1 Tax=Austropuccinia psidii MF-1 TaxID=1389203 RepID=A0A9Q3H557_9BASI|nr:hypothetical protein [Austropuccinia psidii MF-1]